MLRLIIGVGNSPSVRLRKQYLDRCFLPRENIFPHRPGLIERNAPNRRLRLLLDLRLVGAVGTEIATDEAALRLDDLFELIVHVGPVSVGFAQPARFVEKRAVGSIKLFTKPWLTGV